METITLAAPTDAGHVEDSHLRKNEDARSASASNASNLIMLNRSSSPDYLSLLGLLRFSLSCRSTDLPHPLCDSQ